jgi:hypothetical protein
MQVRATFYAMLVFCFKVPYVLRGYQHGRFRVMSSSRAYGGKRGLYLIKNGILYKDQ